MTEITKSGRARDRLREDIAHYARQQNATVTFGFLLKLFFLTPAFGLVLQRRVQEGVVKIPVVGRTLRRVLWARACVRYGCDLAISAEIGGGLYIPHATGIVIGLAKIGQNVTLLQGVTIGNRAGLDELGSTIGNDCYLGAGSTILGDVTVGDRAIIGANSVVLSDVPAMGRAVGSPARLIGAQSDRVQD